MPWHRLLAPLALSALCACGATSPSATGGTPEVASSQSSVQTPASSAAAEPPAVQTPGAKPSDATPAVLTVDDLPDGWSEVPAADSSTGGDSCLDRLRTPGGPFDATVAKTVTFTAGGIGPYLAASAVGRPAEQVLPALDEALVACDGQTSAEGLTTSVQAAPIGGLPSDALAARGSDLAQDGSGVHYVLAAAGTDAATVLVFAVTPLGEVDEALVADALNAGYSRLPTS